MKYLIKDFIQHALQTLQTQWHLVANTDVHIERTRDASHGDFACNIALVLAKQWQRPPRDIAHALVDALPSSPLIAKTEIAGPGFINFFLTSVALQQIMAEVFKQKENYGRVNAGNQEKVIIEFVSANPTGPLHVGHGRSAAYGAALANLLEAADFQVHREYYVNDAGRQMDILATSVWLRYLELQGETFVFPSNGYRGDYIKAIAEELTRQIDKRFHYAALQVFQAIPLDEQADGTGDKEAHIDGLIARAKNLLGEQAYRQVFQLVLNTILDDIREDLADFGVQYQQWFFESTLKDSGVMQREIETLRQAGFLYEKEGALWFKATKFGDDKDRVLIRENGIPTYFASDVAYHLSKYERGFSRIINILGADHHGYIARVKASMQALGRDPNVITPLFVQFAVLFRGKERVQMSTRSGSFVTLRELREEVGSDAARFFYTLRKSEQHMEFDLELAKSQSNDNPVYYIQYAHARICSVFRQLQEKGWTWSEEEGLAAFNYLMEAHEASLLRDVARYPEIIEAAALAYEPHQIAHFLREIANDFHAYYNATLFLVEDKPVRDARLALCVAVQYVLRHGLCLLGVTAPEKM